MRVSKGGPGYRLSGRRYADRMESVSGPLPDQDAVVEIDGHPPLPVVVTAVDGSFVTLRRGEGVTLPPALAEGVVVRVSYVNRSGLYTIEAPVERRLPERFVIGEADRADRVQRRGFVRVNHPVHAACLLLDDVHNRFTAFDGDVVDLGGGGLGLAADVIAPVGATVVVSLALPDGKPPLVTVGHVLPGDATRVRTGRHRLRAQFALIREADRDRIMAFIFTVLREGAPG